MLILRNQAHFIIKKSKISMEKSPMVPQRWDTERVEWRTGRAGKGVLLGGLSRIF